MLEFEALMTLWAKRLVLKTRTPENRGPVRGYSSGQNNVEYEFSYNNLKIQPGDPVYPDKFSQPTRKTTVLYNATYTNDSDREQVNNFRAQKTTTSLAEFTMQEGVCLPLDGVQVQLPEFAANAGLPAYLSVYKTDQERWEEKLTWSVDSQIKVGAGQRIRAQLLVEENEHKADFSITTHISGKVQCVVRDRTNGNFITSCIGYVKEICEDAQSKGLNVPGMTIDGNRVRFVIHGAVKFRYGVEQSVHLKTIPNEDNNDSD